LPGLVYFHGGGLVAGTVATHDSIARALARSGACRVVSVEYRLAPEHPFPAALDDALAAQPTRQYVPPAANPPPSHTYDDENGYNYRVPGK